MNTLIKKYISITLVLTGAGVLPACAKSNAKPTVEVPQVKVPGRGPKSEGCRDEVLKKLKADAGEAATHQSNLEFALDYLHRKAEGKLTPEQVVVVQMMIGELAAEYAGAAVEAGRLSSEYSVKYAQCALE